MLAAALRSASQRSVYHVGLEAPVSQQPQEWMIAFSAALKPKASARVDDVHRLALARAEQAM
jgi:hypothetical protein